MICVSCGARFAPLPAEEFHANGVPKVVGALCRRGVVFDSDEEGVCSGACEASSDEVSSDQVGGETVLSGTSRGIDVPV